jgi:hypothetical protein
MAGDYSRIHHPGTSGRGDCRNEISEHALLRDQPGFPGLHGQRLSELLRLNRVTAIAVRQPGGFGASYFGDLFAPKRRRNAFARRGRTCTGTAPAGVSPLDDAPSGASSRSLTQVTN